MKSHKVTNYAPGVHVVAFEGSEVECQDYIRQTVAAYPDAKVIKRKDYASAYIRASKNSMWSMVVQENS